MSVLFISLRPLDRCENIRSVYEAYQGEKQFLRRTHNSKSYDILKHKKYDAVVTDEFLNYSESPVVMIYHGLAGGKTYGLDQPRPYHKKEYTDIYECTVASSSRMVDMLAKQAGLPKEKVLPLGMPRTDAYIGKKKGDGGTKYANKTMYLYAPTFNTLTQRLTSWEAIDKMLTDDEVLVIKDHQIGGDDPIQGEWAFEHIERVSCKEISTPYLIDCDVLITDYSSIMFDAYILKKPVVLYEKDWGTYGQRRGMYLKYPEGYSSRHATTGYTMINLCREAVGHFEDDPVCVYNRELVGDACDGHAVERVVDLLNRMVKRNDGYTRPNLSRETDSGTPRYSSESKSNVRTKHSTDKRASEERGVHSELLQKE